MPFIFISFFLEMKVDRMLLFAEPTQARIINPTKMIYMNMKKGDNSLI